MIDTSKIIETELPNGWAMTELEKIALNLDGKRIPVKQQNRENMKGVYPYYGASGVIDFVDKYLFDGHFLLIAEDGANLISRTKPIAFQARGRFWVNNHAHILQSLGNIPLLYLEHYFNSIDLKTFITGTAQPKLTQNLMNRISVLLPPLSEQNRIVSKIEELFTNLDAGIESLQKIKAQLKRYRQAVLKHAFEGKLTEEWREANKDKLEPASVMLERIREERKKDEKGKYKELPSIDLLVQLNIPENWVWTRIGEIAQSMKNGIYKPVQFYSENGVACLRMYNIENGSIVWKDIKRMILTSEEIEEYKLEIDDILVNRVNSRELVGKAAVIPLGLEVCVYESKNIRLRLFKNHINSKFIGFWFLLFCHKYFNRNAQQTVGMASINQEQLSMMPLPIPPFVEQNKIVKEIERHFSIADEVEKKVEQSLKQSDRLRQSILKRAFEGKLVPQDPNDESAEKLLGRIKEMKTDQKPSKFKEFKFNG